MRKILVFAAICAVVVAGVAAAQNAPGEDEAKNDDIRRLLELTNAAQMGKQMMDQMTASFKQAMPQVPGEFWDRFMEKVDTNEMTEMVVPIYAKYFTHEDIKGLIEFSESPLGRKFTEVQPKIMQESYAAGQQWGMKLGQLVVQELQKEGHPVPGAPQQ